VSSNSRRPVRVLVVDDSALNRDNLAQALRATGEADVVGEAADGEQGLQEAVRLKPDVVTLDLEMPRMNGFTFLRLLMSKQPTPVIVVSSHSQKENVFKALEFGAIDFVEKPARWASPEAATLRVQLVEKLKLVRSLRPGVTTLRPPSMQPPSRMGVSIPPAERKKASLKVPPRFVIAIASSAGGPAALLELFSQLPDKFRAAVLVAQHMPERFTATFAQRLDLRSGLRVTEARDQDPVISHHAYVCPGNRCMEVEVVPGGADLRIRLSDPEPTDRYVPSADRLLASVARASGPRAVGVVLTGMGDDGTEGALAILKHRGLVIAQSRESAVVPGMPEAAVRAGAVSKVLALEEIAAFFNDLGHSGSSG
jgi:two-component system, chemotaxis family, protein-glutamate methylesterase/glutaminase